MGVILRKEKYSFNFFDKSLALKSMCDYFELDELEVIEYLLRFTEPSFLEFIKNFKLDLFKYDSSNVLIKCRHITTSNENLKTFRKYGLLNLKQVLTIDTPLKLFLKDNDIEFDIEYKLFMYKGKINGLFWYEDECKKCNYGECKYTRDIFNKNTTLTYKDMSCDYRKVITQLYGKLYKDKAETEVFLSGEYNEIYNYSIVSKCPEILLTIDKLIEKSFDEYIKLEYKWKKIKNNQTYLLEFCTNIKNLEFVGTGVICENYLSKNEVLNYYKNLRDVEVDENFYRNMFLLFNSISRFYGGYRKYGQLYPETIIPFSTIDVYKFYKNEDEVEAIKETF